MTGTYALNPRANVAQYAGSYYSYDRFLTEAPLVEIPTREIRKEEFGAMELLKTQGVMMEPRRLDDIHAYLVENGFDAGVTDRLTERRILVPHETASERIERRVLDFFNRRYLPSIDTPASAESTGVDHHWFSQNTFFNLPRRVDPRACQVGLLGVPIASVRASLGTVTGPDHLRLYSRSMCWFDIHKHGVYSEVSLDGGRPEVLGQNVVLRDCGDIDFEASTVSETLERLRTVLADEFFENETYPVIIGGDHAITYPIVRAFLERVPDLGLLHLDAHNDLFYTPHVVYSHAAPISNLLQATQIQRIASFGLRTFADTRMAGLQAVYKEEGADERVRLRSLTATKRMIMNPRLLDDELDALASRPYYLTVDLDVLSETAASQVSTPFGAGLEWHELLTFLDAAFARLNIVGCDVVEHNSLNGDRGQRTGYLMSSLLLLLIDRLARSNPKHAR